MQPFTCSCQCPAIRDHPWRGFGRNRTAPGGIISPGERKLLLSSPGKNTCSPLIYDHLTDLSGEDPVIRILFFLIVAGVIAAGFLYALKRGRREDMYIHPALQQLIDWISRKRKGG